MIANATLRALLDSALVHDSPLPAAGNSLRAQTPMTQLDALAAWPAWGRAVVVLPYWEDLSVQKVADVPGCSPGNVTSRNARDLDRLRAVLGEARTGSGSLSVWPEDQREAGGTSDG